jgi:predicted ATPase
MTVATTDELVLATLAGSSESDMPDATRRETASSAVLSEVVAQVSGGQTRLSKHVEIVGVLEELTERGLVEHTEEGGRELLSLTEKGAERAQVVREQLAETPIEIVDGEESQEVSLEQAAVELGRSLVELAVECSDTEVYHCEEHVSTETLVGREPERETWSTLIDRVAEDQDGVVALVTGPGGVGKTVLAEQFLETAEQRGFETVSARCHGLESEPFQPLRDVLSKCAPGTTPFEETTLDVTDAETAETQQLALFHDVTEALTPDRSESPRVVFLDDLQRADPGTRTYLEYLLGRVSGRPLVLLGSYRPAELPPELPLDPESLPDQASVTRFRLSTLDQSATRGVIERVLGQSGIPKELVAAVHERTGGNPLFVESVVEMLLETDQLDPELSWYPDDPGAIDVPEAVQEAVTQRIGAIEGETKTLLDWASVAGESIPLVLFEAVCEIDGEQLATALSVLVDAGIFEWEDDRTQVAFTSGVLREALLDAQSAATRQHRHGVIASTLSAIAEGPDDSAGDDGDWDTRPGQIARHYERADETSAAIEWYRRAADHAAAVYAHEAAIKHTYRALALARADENQELTLEIGTTLAQRYLQTAQYEKAHRYVRFIRERTPPEDTARRQRLARLAGKIASARGEYETAIEVVTDGREIDEMTDREQCRLLAVEADAQLRRSAYEKARATANRQCELAREIDDTELEARGLLRLGRVANNQSEIDEAREHYRQALQRCQSVDDRHMVARARANLGNLARRTGDLEEAKAYYEAALVDFQAVGDRHMVAKLRVNLGVIAKDRGAYDEAREHYEQGLAELRAVDDRHSVAKIQSNLGVIATERGAYEEAREYQTQALEGLEAVDDRHGEARVRFRHSVVAARQGDYEEARGVAESAIDELEAIGDTHSHTKASLVLAEVAIARGNYDRAHKLSNEALETARELGIQRLVGRTRTHLGRIAQRRGDVETARSQLTDAVEAFDATEPDALAARVELGAVCRHRGEYEAAAEHHQQALEAAAEIDATHVIAACHDQLGAVERRRSSFDRAREHLEKALEEYQTVGDRHGSAIAHLRRGRLARDRGELDTASKMVQTARTRFERIGARHWLGRATHASGTIAVTEEKHERAREQFEQAVEVFEDCKAIADALRTLATLVEQTDDPEVTEQYHDRARRLFDETPIERADLEAHVCSVEPVLTKS